MTTKTPTRTPNYPSIGLLTVLGAVKKLWTAAKRAPFPQQQAAESMGFKSLSGRARGYIASLKQYGLIEGAGKDTLKLTSLSINLVAYGEGTREWDEAIKEAALNPPLFRDLFDTYAESDDKIIRAFLITKKNFSDDAAKNAVRAFRETMAVAKLDEPDLNPTLFDDNIEDVDSSNNGIEKGSNMQGQTNTGTQSVIPPTLANGTRVIIDISAEGEAKISFSGDVNMKTLEFVNGIFKLQKEMFPEKIKAEDSVSDLEQ